VAANLSQAEIKASKVHEAFAASEMVKEAVDKVDKVVST